MIRTTPLLCAMALLLATPAQDARATVKLAVCEDGGPGSTAQAARALDLFLRHMEKMADLKAGTLEGAYQTTEDGCDRYVRDHGAGLAVLDLSTLLRRLHSWKLRPLAHMGSHDARRVHLLTREGEHGDLSSLKDKVVYVSGSNYPPFVHGVLLGGAVPPGHFQMKRARRALTGVRAVARGRAAGALVDSDVVEHLGELELPTKLRSIHQSQGLPGLTLVVVGLHAPDAGLVTKLEGALPRLCDGAGAKLCRTFRVKSFKKAQPKLYRDLAEKLRTGTP